jgi:hypothetical protein
MAPAPFLIVIIILLLRFNWTRIGTCRPTIGKEWGLFLTANSQQSVRNRLDESA